MKEDKVLSEISKIIKEKITSKEKKVKSVINMDKLAKYAEGISLLDVDYGVTYVNEEDNKICISLGDSNPFDTTMLEDQIPYNVTDGYKNAEEIKLEIDCEFIPSEISKEKGSWKMWKKGKWINC